MSVIAPYLILGQCSENPAECGSAPAAAQPAQTNGANTQYTAEDGSPQAQQGAQKPQQPSMMPSLMLMLAIIAIFYFVGIRPQKKQAEKQRSLQDGLKRGDRVFTNSGILGRVQNVDENIITLEVAKNTNIKILKSQINGFQPDETEST